MSTTLIGRTAGRHDAGPALRLALFQPDRPHNLGAALRLSACFGLVLDVIEPCGFPIDDRRVREAGLDRHRHARMTRHLDLAAFERDVLEPPRRLILLSTQAEHPYHRVEYRKDDVLIVGRESAGVPEAVHHRAGVRVRIPLRPGLRSLNLVNAAAIVAAEALRQTGGLDRVERVRELDR